MRAADVTAEGAAAQEAQRVADRTGLSEAEVIGEVGDPAAAIVDAADEHHVDVIVVGSHERGCVSRLFARSVAGDVIKHAHVPVLVAKYRHRGTARVGSAHDLAGIGSPWVSGRRISSRRGRRRRMSPPKAAVT
jgi:K+-sensing histidine kinase KdpD